MKVSIVAYKEWDLCGDEYLQGHDEDITFELGGSDDTVYMKVGTLGDEVYTMSLHELCSVVAALRYKYPIEEEDNVGPERNR